MNSPTPTIVQIACPNCHELNYPQETNCIYCKAFLRSGVVFAPAPALKPPSELKTLLWSMLCLFVALWGLAVAGLLGDAVAWITHPVLIIVAALFAMIATGMYLSELALKEPPPRALLSSRDLMALSWTFAALLGLGQVVKLVVPQPPRILRYAFLPSERSAASVEVWVEGRQGDDLWHITDLGRRGAKVKAIGVVIMRANGGSSNLPTTIKTPQGPVSIAKYHLMVNGRETESLDFGN